MLVKLGRISRGRLVLTILAVATLVLPGVLVLSPSLGSMLSNLGAGLSRQAVPVSIRSIGLEGGVVVPVASANVTVFSADPYAVGNPAWAGINITPSIYPNAGELALLNGTTNANGLFGGTLTPTFQTIASEWTHILYQGTTNQQVALQIHAIYTNVSSSGVAKVFSYYNNYPYNPWTPPTQISFQVVFDLTHPVYTSGSLGPSGTSNDSSNHTNGSPLLPTRVVEATASPLHLTCPSNVATWSVKGSTNTTGPFPFSIANNSDPAATNDYLSMAQNGYSGQFQISFNSISSSSSGPAGSQSVQMSSSPSWSGTQNSYTASGMSGAANYLQSASVVFFYLGSTTIWTFATQFSITYYSGYTCRAYHTVLNYLDYQITKVNGGGSGSLFNLYVAGENHIFGEILTKLLGTSQTQVYSGSLTQSSSVTYSTLDATETAYTNAASAYDKAVNAANYFAAGLGVALVVMMAASVCGVLCSPGNVATAISVVSAAAGFTLAILSAMSSISVTTVTSLNIQSQSLTNARWNYGLPGVTYDLFFWGSSTSELLICSTQAYYPYMPGLVAIDCAHGSSPGSGC